jgi:hypothetical protein
MLKYRDKSYGLTRKSVNAIKHIKRLGMIQKIVGYRYFARVKFESGFHPIKREAIKVIGENGFAVFSGFCWGYGGEGPSGLHELLLQCGIHDTIATRVAFNQKRYNDVGTDWELDLGEEEIALKTNYRNAA